MMNQVAQPCSALFQLVNVIARRLVATKRMESMWQKAMLLFAFPIAFVIKCHSQSVKFFTKMHTDQITQVMPI